MTIASPIFTPFMTGGFAGSSVYSASMQYAAHARGGMSSGRRGAQVLLQVTSDATIMNVCTNDQ